MSVRTLSLWLALIGATRLDLLGASGPLVVTPFLVLSPLIAAQMFWRLWAKGEAVESVDGVSDLMLAVTALMGILVLSTFASYDIATSARRVALLVVQVYLVLAVGLSFLARSDSSHIVYRGAKWGLIAVLVADVLQLVTWLTEPAWLSGGFVDFRPGLYFGVIPRLTGLSSDPNLGGLGIIIFTWLIWTCGPQDRTRNRWLALGAVAVLVTLSRSAVLAGLICAAWHAFSGRQFAVTRQRILLLLGCTLTLLIPYVVSPSGTDVLDDIGRMLGTRLTLDEGSSSEHVQLILLGLEVATENAKQLLIGIGYGNAFLETQSIFPGNEYGNFHSLLITMFAESGVFAAVLVGIIFLEAYRRNIQTRALVAAMFVFNLFQQSHTEPITWLILAMGWTSWNLSRSLSGRSPSPRATHSDLTTLSEPSTT